MASTPSKNKRFLVLDIFRGAFAFFVFLYHLRPFAKTQIVNNRFVDNADLFVDFFFVLSGFVIALNYLNIDSTTKILTFYKKRFLRIYPLHFFMLLVFLGIELLKHILSPYIHVNNLDNPNNNPYSFLSSLLLLNSTSFMVKDVTWNIPSWSISAEMIAYVLFSFSIFFRNKMNRSINYLTISGFILMVSIMLLHYFTKTFKIDYTYDFGYLRGIIGFYTGILCLYAYHATHLMAIKIKPLIFSFLEFIVIALLLLTIYFGEYLKSVSLLYEGVFFLCILVFAFEKGILSILLKKVTILHNLGKYSYSIYMTHAFLISMFNIIFIRLLKFDESSYAYLFILNFILIYYFSSWTYKNVEMRFYNLKR
jgi:peptidoglycan/LPS O-acetylase OafA/YrhL